MAGLLLCNNFTVICELVFDLTQKHTLWQTNFLGKPLETPCQCYWCFSLIQMFADVLQWYSLKTPVLVSLFNKVTDRQLYYKETPIQLFSCEICVIFKKTYFEEHLPTTASWHTFLIMTDEKNVISSVKLY